MLSVFFFQAEDGIRDLTVTGVQTCALPISAPPASPAPIWPGSCGVPRRPRSAGPVCARPLYPPYEQRHGVPRGAARAFRESPRQPLKNTQKLLSWQDLLIFPGTVGAASPGTPPAPLACPP